MKNVLVKTVEKIKTHILSSITFSKSRAVYQIMWKKMVQAGRQAGRPQMTIWRMRFACWIIKATDIHSEYVILLLFHGNNCYTNVPTLYAYTYIACLTECYNWWYIMQLLASKVLIKTLIARNVRKVGTFLCRNLHEPPSSAFTLAVL